MFQLRTPTTVLLLATASLATAAPELLDARFELSLFAEHPSVRTPVGCTIDSDGRLLVVESHTHFRPDGYEGPPADRILAMSDRDGDGRAEQIDVYHEGGEHTMSILWDPRARECLVATRARVFALRDSDGDGKADRERQIARLETTGKYPHNGLCGLAFAGDGGLYFGLGENLGHDYSVIGADGTKLQGGGEGGSIFHIGPDGSDLHRFATGFWNPFGICVAGGEVFAVDNDPDSRPPNRLLHIVGGGDYGYQFRYGRPGTHPLQCWDGELPGTLPMVCGTGEAACSVLPYDGDLWVTSWGHHRIESYTLEPRGASYGATMNTVVRGDENFRPVGLAVDNKDHSVYFTDWVDKSYPLHSKGRVWKLRRKVAAANLRPIPAGEAATGEGDPLGDPDPFVRARGVWAAVRSGEPVKLEAWGTAASEKKVALLSIARWLDDGRQEELLQRALQDDSPDVNLAAVRWVSDDKLDGFSDTLRALVPRVAGNARLFDATVATLKRLGAETGRTDRESLLLEIVTDAGRPAAERIAALQRISPENAKIPYLQLADDQSPNLREAAIWHLTQSEDKRANTLLEKIAALADISGEARADIAMAQAGGEAVPAHPPKTVDAWLAALGDKKGDARAGRRVFFSSHLGMCSRCHRHGSYGDEVGPDLTGIAAREELGRLLESVVNPSEEIAPMFRAWTYEKGDGELSVGIPVQVTGRGGTGSETVIGVDGRAFEVRLADIKSRSPWSASLMPAGLDTRLNVQQMRDLIAFLREGRAAR